MLIAISTAFNTTIDVTPIIRFITRKTALAIELTTRNRRWSLQHNAVTHRAEPTQPNHSLITVHSTLRVPAVCRLDPSAGGVPA